jgi:hypothetical protein
VLSGLMPVPFSHGLRQESFLPWNLLVSHQKSFAMQHDLSKIWHSSIKPV